MPLLPARAQRGGPAGLAAHRHRPHSVQVDNFNSLTGVDARKALEAAPLEIDLISPEPGSTLRDNTGNIVFQGEILPRSRCNTMCA